MEKREDKHFPAVDTLTASWLPLHVNGELPRDFSDMTFGERLASPCCYEFPIEPSPPSVNDLSAECPRVGPRASVQPKLLDLGSAVL